MTIRLSTKQAFRRAIENKQMITITLFNNKLVPLYLKDEIWNIKRSHFQLMLHSSSLHLLLLSCNSDSKTTTKSHRANKKKSLTNLPKFSLKDQTLQGLKGSTHKNQWLHCFCSNIKVCRVGLEAQNLDPCLVTTFAVDRGRQNKRGRQKSAQGGRGVGILM